MSASNVSGLGDLAILDSVSSGQITNASVALVDLNSGVTATLVANSEAFDNVIVSSGLQFQRVDDANPLTLSASQLRAAAGVGEAGKARSRYGQRRSCGAWSPAASCRIVRYV